ncbi:cysteine--1-D-myo-inosityl 2-amino-2-deoxy-alpha-D-glucopyranoside ligase [Corynebacterium sp. sy039]|uniref:cysteine--1-D-myo-inosityl 2-amino-2-deoxy-alpha-D-glucopyranoside ligase n=1 Tax=Corynebacterium sp. sy039 TaxID=2599641 RepID=UPI0011B37B14|nr:cysteine--1-D-myo-inosityl 2-amino-2-deoxy-alpha-D-glucopyranoside ligase [Corynebacterium sp. sy039]QDZ42615.1 cysteine--1-D-myo-inosityl 2-amino-2-deoxy-alpha-D-glucopyranoside ligase [Corynebacterium sp. sy039]
MYSWRYPTIPAIDGNPIPLSLYDTADEIIKPVLVKDQPVGMYVCGITPYDSTHLGHAATYVTFDLIYRQLLDNGHKVHYVQNVTDIDDPLFERAQRDGVDWKELGSDQIELFRSDMTALLILPPQDYVGAMESIDEVIAMVQTLLDKGAAYIVDDQRYPDVYASIAATKNFGYESHYSREQMDTFFAERGGDPQRLGKRDSLDALLWRAHREGEPFWDAPFGKGRPGWHIECSAIATTRLGASFAIQGGGSDLIFPHHEFSAAHAEASCGSSRMAEHYVHTGMIGLDGTKMSKSLGNLVFVSALRNQGYAPSAIRLGIYAGHYRQDRDWSTTVLETAQQRLTLWSRAAKYEYDFERATRIVQKIRTALAHDLDTPTALAHSDQWAQEVLNSAAAQGEPVKTEAGAFVADAFNALLGVVLDH